MANEEITNQDEVLEDVEQQDELVETPEIKGETVQEEEVDEMYHGKKKMKKSEAAHKDEEEEEVKKEEVKMPSTKSGMIKALFDKVNQMKKEEVTSKWKELMDVAEAEDTGGPTPEASDNKKAKVAAAKKTELRIISAGKIPDGKIKQKNMVFL